MEGTLNTYRSMETHGKSQLDLIIQVYDGAIVAYRKAAELYQNEDFTTGYKELEKAKRFVVHLYTTLDAEKGGEIAENLGSLYAFVVNETNIVEATKDSSQIDDIITVLENLRSGWAQLREKTARTGQKPTQTEKATPGGGFSTSV
ncbi:MAG: flagellar export chaperone FliS [candidate division Zixibacteria bacterium]|nr:flagellar export chaperone FliS [candidate division Zixibacteria bacterium]